MVSYMDVVEFAGSLALEQKVFDHEQRGVDIHNLTAEEIVEEGIAEDSIEKVHHSQMGAFHPYIEQAGADNLDKDGHKGQLELALVASWVIQMTLCTVVPLRWPVDPNAVLLENLDLLLHLEEGGQ